MTRIPDQQRDPEQDQVPVALLLFLAAIAIAVNARVLANELVYDDVLVVANNPHFASWNALLASVDEPYWYWSRHLYRPLTTFSLGVDHLLGGGSPVVFHVVNLVLHGLATALAGMFAARWLPRAAAIATMFVFAVHPVHVEVVSTAVGRGELLSAVFLLAFALVASSDTDSTLARRLALAALAACALASKEVGIVAPVLGLAIARLRHLDWKRSAHDIATPALAGVLPVLVMRFTVLGELKGDLPHPALVMGSVLDRLEVALAWLPLTVASTFLPRSAPIDIAPSLAQLTSPSSLTLATGVLCAVIGAGALGWHFLQRSRATLGAVLLVLGFLPVANLLFASGVVASGRTLYAPSLGAAMLIGGTTAVMWERRGAWRSLGVLALASWLTVGAVTSFRDTGLWRDEAHLRDAMLARQPESYRGYVYAAELARGAGDVDKAAGFYRQAVALFPNENHLLYSAANAYLVVGDTTRGTELLGRAVELAPGQVSTRTRLVRLLLTTGDTTRAGALLDAGLRLMPDQRAWRQWREQIDGT